jgi:hypothetical protein
MTSRFPEFDALLRLDQPIVVRRRVPSGDLAEASGLEVELHVLPTLALTVRSGTHGTPVLLGHYDAGEVHVHLRPTPRLPSTALNMLAADAVDVLFPFRRGLLDADVGRPARAPFKRFTASGPPHSPDQFTRRKETNMIDLEQVTRSLCGGYTIKVLGADHCHPRARRGAKYRGIRAFETDLEQVRRALGARVGAVIRWSLVSDDRIVTYEGRLALATRPADAASAMAAHANLILSRRSLMTAPTIGRAELHLYAATALTAEKSGPPGEPPHGQAAVYHLAVALMQTSYDPAPRPGTLRVGVARA